MTMLQKHQLVNEKRSRPMEASMIVCAAFTLKRLDVQLFNSYEGFP